MIHLAMREYAVGNIDQARQKIAKAITIDPSLLERSDEYHDALCHHAISMPVPDPVSYAERVLDNLPAEADPLKRTRKSVLSDVHLACAFRDYEAEQWSGVIRHAMRAAQYRPAVFKNRGVISIFLKSMLALASSRRFA
jgi:hypothetical protein